MYVIRCFVCSLFFLSFRHQFSKSLNVWLCMICMKKRTREPNENSLFRYSVHSCRNLSSNITFSKMVHSRNVCTLSGLNIKFKCGKTFSLIKPFEFAFFDCKSKVMHWIWITWYHQRATWYISTCYKGTLDLKWRYTFI